jgi:hypothetical protein
MVRNLDLARNQLNGTIPSAFTRLRPAYVVQFPL